MKHRLLTLLFLIGCATTLPAQAEIVGTIIDSTGTTLPGANAVLLRRADSLLTAFGTTDDKGVFRMLNVQPGDYFLRVSFIGYERPDQDIKVTAEDQYFGLGELKMYPAGFFLSGVEVKADRIPIRMKGDTMLYDAAAFGVSENAVVEDLLRRLPGMTVDASGQITWQGKPISEVMINGKPFFAGNTTLLTQNLDAKAVKSVQVFDQKSDKEEVTGVDDGNENITVNLETTEDFKAKLFGDVYAGYGTQERYQAGGKAFRISDATQWGVLGTINNINQVGFSGDEISGFNSSSGRGGGWWFGSGGGGRQTSGLQYDNGNATGQNRSIAAGLNFGQTLGKGGQLTANYALFDREQTQRATTLQNFRSRNDGQLTNTLQTNIADSYRHSLGFELRQKIDSVGRLRIEGDINFLGGENRDTANTTITQESGTSNYSVDNRNTVDQPQGRVSARYNTKLSREVERTLGVNARVNFSRNEQDVNLFTRGLSDGLLLPGALVNGLQVQDRLTNNFNFNGEVEYGEPIAEKWNLQFSTEYDYDRNEGVYDFIFDEQTTRNDLTRSWAVIVPSVSLVHRFGKGGNFRVGTKYQLSNLMLTGDDVLDENYNYVLPYINYRNRLEKGFFSANLSTEVNAPSIQQLQTIAEPSVSGRIGVGNPKLRPSRSTNFNTYLWYNDQFRALSGNIGVNAGYTDDAFGNEVTFTEGGQQIFKPINVSHAYYANSWLSGTIGMNFINGEMRLEGNASLNEGVGIVDGISQANRNIRLTGGVNITTEMNEDSYITVGYKLNNLRNTFEDSERAGTVQNIHDISLDVGLEFMKWWRFETRFAYNLYEENEFAPAQDIYDMRVSLEVRPFKKVGHYFRLSGSDLFNQNTIINRNVNQFVTTETTANALGRYFLATFFYKL